jgi:hypothetical protein
MKHRLFQQPRKRGSRESDVVTMTSVHALDALLRKHDGCVAATRWCGYRAFDNHRKHNIR